MALDNALNELSATIGAASGSAVLRVLRVSDEEATIRVYAPASDQAAIKDAVRDKTFSLLTEQGIDVQVLVYDIAIDLPPDA
jgi:hypothetical protein